MKLTSIFLFLILAGCGINDPMPQTDWGSAPMARVCTEQQMAKVEKETTFCRDNGGYFSTYCYGAALVRNCPLKPGDPK